LPSGKAAGLFLALLFIIFPFASARRVVSDVIALLYCDDNISLFVSLVNIPVSFDDLLQGIASINDRFELARFNEFFQGDEILSCWGCCPSDEGRKIDA